MRRTQAHLSFLITGLHSRYSGIDEAIDRGRAGGGFADQRDSRRHAGVDPAAALRARRAGRRQGSSQYHWFKSDFGNISYGQEFDIGLGNALRWVKGLSAKAEYADFNEGAVLAGAARKPNTRKIWLTLIYDFE